MKSTNKTKFVGLQKELTDTGLQKDAAKASQEKQEEAAKCFQEQESKTLKMSFFRNAKSKAEDFPFTLWVIDHFEEKMRALFEQTARERDQYRRLRHLKAKAQERGDMDVYERLDREMKSRKSSRVPAVTWQSGFKHGGARGNGNGVPTLLFMADFDKMAVDPAEHWESVKEEVLRQFRVLLVHTTISGAGLRVVALRTRGSYIYEDQVRLAEAMSLELDESCHDEARLSFCAGEILYVDTTVFRDMYHAANKDGNE